MLVLLFGLLAAAAVDPAAASQPSPLEARLAQLIREGDAAAALPLADRVRAAKEQSLGRRTLALAQALDDLADQVVELDAARAHAWAGRQLERSLAIQHERRGREHPGQAGTLERLSNLYFVQGDWERAER